jgi:hypothetical protein
LIETGKFNWGAIPVKTGVTADPAAGANPVEITFVGRCLFISGSNTIVCDATVVNRRATLAVKRDATNIDQTLWQGTAITASQTTVTNIVRGVVSSVPVLNSQHVFGVDGQGIEMPAGGKIQLVYDGLQAGDNAGVFRYSYKEALA